jgi:Protein of unknown function (DUF2480)
MAEVFVNKVAESGIITLDLEDYYPKADIMVFDMKDYLFMGLILKEKDFRETLKTMDWQPYQGKTVTVTCTADAIIPVWAYMLVSAYLQPLAAQVLYGTQEQATNQLLLNNIATIDASAYADQRVVIKGCGEKSIGEAAYLQITNQLRPVVKSIMYGEPCSTVPIFKRKP